MSKYLFQKTKIPIIFYTHVRDLKGIELKLFSEHNLAQCKKKKKINRFISSPSYHITNVISFVLLFDCISYMPIRERGISITSKLGSVLFLF